MVAMGFKTIIIIIYYVIALAHRIEIKKRYVTKKIAKYHFSIPRFELDIRAYHSIVR